MSKPKVKVDVEEVDDTQPVAAAPEVVDEATEPKVAAPAPKAKKVRASEDVVRFAMLNLVAAYVSRGKNPQFAVDAANRDLERVLLAADAAAEKYGV